MDIEGLASTSHRHHEQLGVDALGSSGGGGGDGVATTPLLAKEGVEVLPADGLPAVSDRQKEFVDAAAVGAFPLPQSVYGLLQNSVTMGLKWG